MAEFWDFEILGSFVFSYELTKYNLLILGSRGRFPNTRYKVTLNLTAKKFQHLFKIISNERVKRWMVGKCPA